MEYQDYLELRRRAEKRLMLISAWPFVAFQSFAYLLMFMQYPQDLFVAFFAGCGALLFTAGTLLLVRRRTAANRERRRQVIDETLEDAVSTGWPIEEPSPRELRLLASLLDDDLETRAGFGKAMVWLTALATALWLPSAYFAVRETGIIPFQGSGIEFFTIWLFTLGGVSFFQRRARRAADRRVRAALDRATVWSHRKRRHPSEATWWDDDGETPAEKPKREATSQDAPWQLDDDGELQDDSNVAHRRLSE
ncbi:MAG: hypothetical protein U0452_06425 [Anaerolineae bacterium]